MKDSCLDEPELRFPDFTDNWETIRIGDFIEFIPTNSLSRAKLNLENGTVKNIHYGDIHTKFPTIVDCSVEEIPYINPNENISKFKDKQYCKNGDLIIADASEDYADIGKAIELVNVNTKLVAGLHTILARDKLNKTVSGFKGYLFLNENLRKQIKIQANGISVLGISKNNIAKLDVNLPSLQEQEKIVSFLRAVDKKIELLEKKYLYYNNFKKYSFQQLFSKNLRFKDENGENYKDWEEILLKDADIIISDGNYGEAYPKGKDFKNEGVPFIRSVNIQNSKLTFTDMRYISPSLHTQLLQGHLKENDILITTRGDIGLVAYVTKEFANSNINAQICLLRVNDNNINPKFLFYLLSTPFLQNQLLKFQTGSALKQLPKNNLKYLKLLIPPYDEQKKIVDFLVEIDKSIDLIQANINEFNQFKKGLLQKMFV